jgi:hypothetical protein
MSETHWCGKGQSVTYNNQLRNKGERSGQTRPQALLTTRQHLAYTTQSDTLGCVGAEGITCI